MNNIEAVLNPYSGSIQEALILDEQIVDSEMVSEDVKIENNDSEEHIDSDIAIDVD